MHSATRISLIRTARGFTHIYIVHIGVCIYTYMYILRVADGRRAQLLTRRPKCEVPSRTLARLVCRYCIEETIGLH